MGLLVRPRLRVDTADVWFRIRIGSSSHALPNNYFKPRRNQRVAVFLSFEADFSGGGKFQLCHLF